jgi:hypothetical protein
MQGRFSIKTTLFLLIASVVLMLAGIGIPMHFRAVSGLLLEKAGKGTKTVETVVSDYVIAGKTGPVRLFWESGLAKPSEPERLAIVDLLSRKPIYVYSGGSAPYYEALLSKLPVLPDPGKETHVFDMFLPDANREIALKEIDNGSNIAARELMKARSIEQWQRFIAVRESGGQPLDASIAILAMLAQSDCLAPEFTRTIPSMAEGALSGDITARYRLENTLLSVLSLSRRMDWTQLTEFMRRLKTPEYLADAASRIVTGKNDDYYVIYTSTILADDYGPVGEYLSKHDGDDGMGALKKSLSCGRGALDVLLNKGEAMYVPPRIVSLSAKYLSWMRPDLLITLALHHPKASLAAKNLLIFASGTALAAALSAIWLTFLPIPDALKKKNRHLLDIGNLFVAIAITIAIWLVIEPNLLRFTTEHPARAVFEISAGLVNNTSQSQGMNPNSLDQASILSLFFFFFVQLAVYVFCVIRVKRLKTTNISAKVKLTLLENEDNLFDLCLYIGLFGTVGSLLMIAMGIIQASLVAAYSSTLFGILFTALLKIVHVRIIRRDLIIESSKEDGTAAPTQTKA